MVTWHRIDSNEGFDAHWDLLALAVGYPDADAQGRLRVMYMKDPTCQLFAVRDGGVLVGVVGWRLKDAASGEILHISVVKERRGEGLGRTMILGLQRLAPEVGSWIAETDDDALGFYLALGFHSADLGEVYPGVLRYRCTLAVGRPYA
ncbi:MAG: GNAT family N-acetyltransferase [Thermaerobacter sp.]|nr:GNAT family N-acetyltransferase [Thermaerobacter sp.]